LFSLGLMRPATVAFAATLAFILTGCSDDGDGESSAAEQGPRTLKAPTDVTRVDIQSPDGRVLKRADSSADIQRILGFLESHRAGWLYSHSGFPTPPLKLFFYKADRCLGHFGVSCGFYFETDLASEDSVTLRGIDASSQDVGAFLAVVGMPDFHFEGEGCK
jgi:hypothetical protein